MHLHDVGLEVAQLALERPRRREIHGGAQRLQPRVGAVAVRVGERLAGDELRAAREDAHLVAERTKAVTQIARDTLGAGGGVA